MKTEVLEILRKAGMPLEKKSNEVINTGNTGFGKEFIPAEIFKAEFIDVEEQEQDVLSLLTGNHGVGLAKKQTFPLKDISLGDTKFRRKTEWASGTPSSLQDASKYAKPKTKNVTLNQDTFICEVVISDEQLRHNAVDTESYVRDRLVKGFRVTVLDIIVNGDTAAGANANINLIDGTPASDVDYLTADGLRKKALAGSYTKSVGTLAAADYNDLLGVMGRYAADPSQVLLLQNQKVTTKMLGVSEFLLALNAGTDRNTLNGGLRPTPFGVSVATHRVLANSKNDGNISGTGSNNVYGNILALHRAAAQFGFGQDFTFEVTRVPGYGYLITCTFEMGLAVVGADASQDDTSVALGINVTL